MNDVVQETYGYLHSPKLTALNDPNLWIKSWVALEAQINSDGFVKAKLRVVAENEAARKFYRREGWLELKSYPHEKWGFLRVDMQKELAG